MPDIGQMTSDLRGLPDQALQGELQNPTGLVPSYLVLGELQRRQLMRQAAQKQQQQGQSGSVLDDVVRNMMAQQPPQGGPPAPAGMVPPRQGQQPMPGAAPPSQMMMARGGAIRMADGGGYTEDDVNNWIDKYSTQYGVDPDLARAVRQAESGNQGQGAVSPKGALGLFQLEPGAAKDVGVDRTDPEQNVKGGINYLANMLKNNKGDESLALAAYNAGQGNVNKFHGVPPFKETMGYVPTVLAIRDQLRQRHPAQQTAQATQQPTGDWGTASAEKSDLGWTTEQPIDYVTQNIPSATRTPPSSTTGEASRDTDTSTATPPAATPPATPAAPPAAPAIIPSAAAVDPFSAANIEQKRQLYDTLMGTSPEMRQQLAAQRAATIAQLQGLQQEAISRYHNPSPWEFLAQVGAGMGASHQLSMPMAFAEGVGRAWQVRDQQQDRALTEANTLQQQIDAIQNVGQSERERQAGQMVTLLTRPEPQDAELKLFAGMPGAMLGQKDKPPGPGFAFREDPRTPGWGFWVPTNQPLKPPKEGPPETQVFAGAVKSIAQQYGLDKNTTYENLPDTLTLTKPVTLRQDMPQADGTVKKAGTVLPAGTQVFPQNEAELLRDRSKAQQQFQTSTQRLLGTVEGRRQLANDPNFAPDWTDEQKQYFIQSGKKPENIDSLAMAVANYQIPLREAMSRGALSDRNALLGKIRQINPQYNEGEQEAQYKNYQRTETNFGSGKQAGQIQTTGTLVHHLGQLYDAANALKQGGVTGDFRALNKIAKDLKMQVGATPQDTYRAIVHAVGPETTKAYIASGGTYQDRADVEKDFSEDLPPDALLANISSRARLLGGVMTPLNQEYVNNTYGRGTRHLGFYAPELIGELNRIAPTALKTISRQQVQDFANQNLGGDFAAAQKHFADANIFLRP